MLNEKKPCTHDFIENEKTTFKKESFMRSIVDGSLNEKMIELEILDTINGRTNLDYFEYAKGSILADLANKFHKVLISNPSKFSFCPEMSVLQNIRRSKFSTFIKNFSEIIKSEKEENLGNFIKNNRKFLGMASSPTEIFLLTELLLSIPTSFDWEKYQPNLYQFPGSFNPFPHNGHLATADIIHDYSTLNDKKPSLVGVWTFANNPHKPDINQTFKERLDMLHRGFIDTNFSSIINIEGDSSGQRQHEQMKLIAEIAGDKIRYCLGGDAFLKKVGDMQNADIGANSLFKDLNTLWYITPRPEDNMDDIIKGANEVSERFGSILIILPSQKLTLSGTMIREMTLDQIYDKVPPLVISSL